jgi:hypothetical protein
MSGEPNFAIASSTASMQKSVVRLLESGHAGSKRRHLVARQISLRSG